MDLGFDIKQKEQSRILSNPDKFTKSPAKISII